MFTKTKARCQRSALGIVHYRFGFLYQNQRCVLKNWNSAFTLWIVSSLKVEVTFLFLNSKWWICTRNAFNRYVQNFQRNKKITLPSRWNDHADWKRWYSWIRKFNQQLKIDIEWMYSCECILSSQESGCITMRAWPGRNHYANISTERRAFIHDMIHELEIDNEWMDRLRILQQSGEERCQYEHGRRCSFLREAALADLDVVNVNCVVTVASSFSRTFIAKTPMYSRTVPFPRRISRRPHLPSLEARLRFFLSSPRCFGLWTHC